MKIVVVVATGVVEKAVVAGSHPRDEVVQVGKTHPMLRVITKAYPA